VLPEPNGADEDTPIDVARQQPYGRHRHELERFAHAHFPNALTVRLPGLFGPGLKKNALYDLLHGNETHKIHSGGVFQFYPLVRLWADLNRAAALGVPLVHFATAPLSVREIAAEAFGLDFVNELPTPPARYDFRSRHAAALGGADGYLYGRDAVLDELRRFVAAERSRLRATGILEPGLAA
jgi:nucleoside-diphosphate-sugar epimerase